MNGWTGRTQAGGLGAGERGSGEDYLDGNALAGPLSEIFAIDMTSARGRCDSCGAVSAIAQARLYVNAPAMVLRCPSCSGVLLRLREDGGQAVLDLRGFSYLTVDLG
jgi:hypothetical protein